MVSEYNLKRGISNSCGCYQRERASAARMKHGASVPRRRCDRPPEYRAWQDMVKRCDSPTAAMTAEPEPTWGDLHGHPGCRGCQMCFDCLLDPDSPEYVDITDEMIELPPSGGSEEEEDIPF